MTRMTRARAVPLLMVATLAFGGVQARSQEVGRDALADLSIEELMRIHVGVASLKQTSILDTPSMVSVIDDNLIEKYNIQSVAEAVNLVAGMSVLRTYLKRDLPTDPGQRRSDVDGCDRRGSTAAD
jgi:outer membrane receptor protein involved in Fe transport